jgi:hypothetical protein
MGMSIKHIQVKGEDFTHYVTLSAQHSLQIQGAAVCAFRYVKTDYQRLYASRTTSSKSDKPAVVSSRSLIWVYQCMHICRGPHKAADPWRGRASPDLVLIVPSIHGAAEVDWLDPSARRAEVEFKEIATCSARRTMLPFITTGTSTYVLKYRRCLQPLLTRHILQFPGFTASLVRARDGFCH